MKKSSLIFALAIGLVLGSTTTFAALKGFPDVPEDHWAKAAVDWAQEKNLVKGYEDGTFGGNKNLSRYEMVQILSQYDQMVHYQTYGLEDETNRLQVQQGLRKMGFIKKVYEKDGKYYIDFDDAQWLIGDEAKKEMLKDGECDELPTCNLPNGVYINNDDSTPKTYGVDESGDFRFLLNGSEPWEYVSFYDFKDTFATPKGKYIEGPFWIELDKDVIFSAQQQYTP